MIDDLDRLTQQEVGQMFQLVKSIADFPNMTYLLAFDEDVIVDALEAEDGVENGREYLEKIIQLPIQIPVPEEGSLEDLITTRLLEIAGERPIDVQRLRDLLQDGILPTVNTPRHTTRLANTVDFNYAPVEDETNFVDLVGIELLKIFYKDIYEEIRTNPDRFIGTQRSLQRQRTEEDDDYDDILPKDGKGREPAKAILKRLFPRVGSNLSSSYSMSTRNEQYRTEKRVCHWARYRVYFRLALPQGMIPWEKMEYLLDATDDEDEFTTQVLALLHEDENEPAQIAEFIERIHERQGEIPIANIPNVVRAFLSAGDQIIRVKDVSDNSFHSIEGKIIALILGLIERREDERLGKAQEDSDEKVEILKSAIKDGNSPYLSMYLTLRLLRDHGEYNGSPLPEDDRIIDLEDIDELKQATDQIIRKYADGDQLLSVPMSGMVLKHWPEFTGGDAPEQWVEPKIESRDEFIELLGGFFMSSSLRSSGSVGVTEQSYADPRWLEPYLNLDETRERVEGYEMDDLDESQKTIVEIYRTAWKHLDTGDDPGSAETWHFRSPMREEQD